MFKIAIPLLGIFIIMLDGYDLQCIGFVAPDMARDWNVTLASFGPAFSAGFLGTIPGALLAGSGTRRLGLNLTLTIALLIFGIGTLATAFVNTLALLVALR